MIWAIALIIMLAIVITVLVLKSKDNEVWHNIIAESASYKFILQGYNTNAKCFLFKIHNNDEWSLLRDFQNKEEANKFLSESLATRLELLSDQEMGEDIPPPRILDLSSRRK